MKVTEKQLRNIVRSVIKESFAGAQGTMKFMNISSFKELYDSLSDEFRSDFDECSEWERFVFEGQDASDLDAQYLYGSNSLADAWEEFTDEIGWAYDLDAWAATRMDRVFLAMHLMINRDPNITQFTYSFDNEKQFQAIQDKMEELIIDYELPASFRDVVESQLSDAEDNWSMDRNLGSDWRSRM